jgi:3-oxoacyl-[acyl-carrier protein] reductase
MSATDEIRDRRVALVTGAGQGLGAALAMHLAGMGYAVAVHYRTSHEGAQSVVRTLREQGGEAECFQAQLHHDSEARACLAAVEKRWGRLDVLIQNAGIFVPKGIEELTEEEWNAGLDSTVTASFFTARAALPLLRKSGVGRIIHIGDSMAGRADFSEPALSYYVGKTGVWMLTRTLAVQEAPHGITVNCISPGILERSEPLSVPMEYPMRRRTSVEDITGAMEYLLSPAASQVTGTQLLVSGGWNIVPTFASVHTGLVPLHSG